MSNDTIKALDNLDPNLAGDWKEITATDVAGLKRALDIFIRGGTSSFTPSGLNNGGQVTEVTINDTGWTPLNRSGSTTPTGVGPLASRNAIRIQNTSATQIKINYKEAFDNSYGYIGMVVNPNGESYYDITDTILLYARSQSGSVTLNVEEIA